MQPMVCLIVAVLSVTHVVSLRNERYAEIKTNDKISLHSSLNDIAVHLENELGMLDEQSKAEQREDTQTDMLGDVAKRSVLEERDLQSEVSNLKSQVQQINDRTAGLAYDLRFLGRLVPDSEGGKDSFNFDNLDDCFVRCAKKRSLSGSKWNVVMYEKADGFCTCFENGRKFIKSNKGVLYRFVQESLQSQVSSLQSQIVQQINDRTAGLAYDLTFLGRLVPEYEDDKDSFNFDNLDDCFVRCAKKRYLSGSKWNVVMYDAKADGFCTCFQNGRKFIKSNNGVLYRFVQKSTR